MSRAPRSIVVLAISLLLGPTACGTTEADRATPQAVAEPSPEVTPSPTPLPSPTASEDDTLDESDPLRLDGIGPVSLGMTVDEAEAASGYEIFVSSDFTEACRQGHFRGDDLPDLWFMLSYGEIVRIDIYGRSAIETEAGIRVSSHEDDVLSSYDRIEREPHPYLMDRGEYLVYEPADRDGLLLIFETDRGTVTSFRSGYKQPVRYIEGCA